jgi:hypothetical protein
VALVAVARLAPRHERLWCCLRCRPPPLVLAAPPVWLRLFGFNGWFSSLEGEGLSAAAFALKLLLQLSRHPRRRLLSLLLERLPAGHPEFVIPQAFRRGGCSCLLASRTT